MFSRGPFGSHFLLSRRPYRLHLSCHEGLMGHKICVVMRVTRVTLMCCYEGPMTPICVVMRATWVKQMSCHRAALMRDPGVTSQLCSDALIFRASLESYSVWSLCNGSTFVFLPCYVRLCLPHSEPVNLVFGLAIFGRVLGFFESESIEIL